MKASQLFKIGDFRTVEVDVPTPHGKELLVKIGSSMLSTFISIL